MAAKPYNILVHKTADFAAVKERLQQMGMQIQRENATLRYVMGTLPGAAVEEVREMKEIREMAEDRDAFKRA